MASKQSVFIRLLVLREFSYAHQNQIGLTIAAMMADRCSYLTNINDIPSFRHVRYYFTELTKEEKKMFVCFIVVGVFFNKKNSVC